MRKNSSNEMARASTAEQPPAWAKLVSGSVGSIITALTVTPLEVVKVRQQAAAKVSSPPNMSPAAKNGLQLCPKGCGTFILNNGLTECLLPKNAVPYFDVNGKIVAEAGTLSATATAHSSQHVLAGDAVTAATSRAPSTGAAAATASSSAQQSALRNLGTFAMMRRIFAKEGLSGIYSGLGAGLIMGVPNTVLYFVTYEELISRWRTQRNKDWIPAVAGGSARIVASAATAPFELVRTRQAAAIGSKVVTSASASSTMTCSISNTSIMQEFQRIVQAEGAIGLYKGLSPTLMRDVPFSAIYWMTLEQFRAMWRRKSSSMPTPLEQFGQALFNGSTAGMFAAACTTPLDVVKTRRQTAMVEHFLSSSPSSCDHAGAKPAATNAAANQPSGTTEILRTILRDEGIAGLWRGNVTRMIKVAPACAIMLSSYELGKRLLTPA